MPFDIPCSRGSSSGGSRSMTATPFSPSSSKGRCDEGECNQFSISISNGERGMTVRFDSEAEFRNFLERGAAEKR